MYQQLFYNKMKSYKKNINIKTNVWLRQCYKNCIYLCQCKSCETLVFIPKEISNNLKLKDRKFSFKINGVGEFGHLISEKNGGSVEENNLVIQCKTCNLNLGNNNLKQKWIDSIMLDYETLEEDINDIEMEYVNYSII
jgi:hypothetical protein